ncbi:2694_t:CDS:2 [Gigaspora rosea]|nr:2694_t:CDS:2 [Gigaspora rosea]
MNWGTLQVDLEDLNSSEDYIITNNNEHEDIFWNSFRNTLTFNKRGTHLANIEPNQNQEKSRNLVAGNNVKKKPQVETITRISKYNYWQWPIVVPLAGYIVAHPLPHFGAPAYFSPAEITNLCNKELHRPEPKVLPHTKPQSKWTMALLKL